MLNIIECTILIYIFETLIDYIYKSKRQHININNILYSLELKIYQNDWIQRSM